MNGFLLSVLIWLPVFGGIAVLFAGEQRPLMAKGLALLVSTATLLFGLPLFFAFDGSTAAMQFVEQRHWIEILNVQYYLGVDGFSAPLILLTLFFGVIVVLAGWRSIRTKVYQYMAALLVMEGIMVGVFAALDGLLFYIFFEAMLIPMFLIIGIWGGPRRIYASLKFFLYTFLGSVLMLIGLIYLYIQSGTWNILEWHALPLSMSAQKWLFMSFLAGFAIKIPMFPVHTWLPDAHVEAPAGGSVILAAIMLKIGGYGLIRFSMPITPDAAAALDWLVIALSLIAIVYIGLVAIVQEDMKKLIAYSSVAHMGFVTLGLFVAFGIYRNTGGVEGAAMGVEGAMVQMVSHGFISGALFLSVGVLYDRMNTRMIKDYGGVVNTMPWFAFFWVLFFMANSGLPGTSGFVGEFMVILSSFQASFWYAMFAAISLILSASYSLWLVKRTVFGPVTNREVHNLEDINGREAFILGILAIAILALGLYPMPLIDMMHGSVDHLLHQITQSKVL